MLKASARAVTTVEIEAKGVGLSTFRVEVWGTAPFDYVRIYKIQAKDDNAATLEGLNRFQDEMEALFTAKG